LPQLFARDDFTGTFKQCLQDLERLTSESLPEAGLTHFARFQVYLEDAEPHYAWRVGAGGDERLRPNRFVERVYHKFKPALGKSEGTCAN
jgi:hypothetical protein